MLPRGMESKSMELICSASSSSAALAARGRSWRRSAGHRSPCFSNHMPFPLINLGETSNFDWPPSSSSRPGDASAFGESRLSPLLCVTVRDLVDELAGNMRPFIWALRNAFENLPASTQAPILQATCNAPSNPTTWMCVGIHLFTDALKYSISIPCARSLCGIASGVIHMPGLHATCTPPGPTAESNVATHSSWELW